MCLSVTTYPWLIIQNTFFLNKPMVNICIPTLRKMKMVWYKWMVHQANAPSCCAYSKPFVWLEPLLCIFKNVILVVWTCSFACSKKSLLSLKTYFLIFFEVSVNHYALAMLSTQQGKKRCSLFKNIDGTFQNWNVTDAKDTHLQTRKVKIEMLRCYSRKNTH